ncbi:MAG: transcription-repair coupling factor [Deltaproteobacteria bacterium]|nr:transcription-repair coupling factor [Deltaproteobacteria bacterium]
MQNNQDRQISHLISEMAEGRNPACWTGLVGSERAYAVSCLYRQLKTPLVVVTQTAKEAERFLEDLDFFLCPLTPPLWLFQPYNILSQNLISFSSQETAKRIRILYLITQSHIPPVIVTTPAALHQKLIPKKELLDFAEPLMEGEETDRDLLTGKMLYAGYVRSAIVEEPGDFSVRGGILDVFSPMYDDPLRIEFFGDTVESLRFFSAASQRKLKNTYEATILPAREVILKKENLASIIERIRIRRSELDIPAVRAKELIERIKNEGVFPGIESLMQLIYKELDTFFTYLPENTRFILANTSGLKEATMEAAEQVAQNLANEKREERLHSDFKDLYLEPQEIKKYIDDSDPVVLDPLPVSKPEFGNDSQKSIVYWNVKDNNDIVSVLRDPPEKERILLPLAEWIDKNKKSGCTTLLVCRKSQTDRLNSLLEPYSINSFMSKGLPDISRNRGMVYICTGRVSAGFIWQQESLAVITEDEIFGKKRRRKKVRQQKIQTSLLEFEDLKKGDLVVHNDHGIGQYHGLEKLSLDGVTGDFLLILYKDGDKLYLPVERMNVIRKYLGVDGISAILDKMGGKAWSRVKRKAMEAVEKIAGELLSLYAGRKVKKGFAFSGNDNYFQDFEAGFDYDETPDQIKAIDDVLNDMESHTPMDRLVCGDVGYGKTEVALRASFKAVCDGKQVAVLVPTTILAEQHLKTFRTRFKRYPVIIECLNRFRSQKEQQSIVDRLKQGKIDIAIGTHRLLQKDVGFKDLGLLVLDEEQRFGVKHKEKLKKMRSIVDVLALTATPIPRTLHMSLMGVRDISVISTPPEERHPIITYISEFDDNIVAEAIRKELKRGGQIFFIHNNIHSITSVAERLGKLVPEASLNVAHGRLKENELENIMLKFINRKIDMLVCTTIVESGLDIASANTILVNRADRFGLAQLYQLRGRVGRADEQAYAYLFIPKDKALSPNAGKRLKVLMEYSDLGSGFQIAMSDLQIRGGGAALGISQSGHIAAVGYDMFLQLIENAISELKGEPVVDKLEPEINMDLSAFIPESYVTDIDQRLSAYRRLAKMTDLKEISEFKEELTDRYGPLPAETTNLLLKIMLKVLSIKGGIRRLDLSEKNLSLYFSEIHQKNPFGIIDIIEKDPGRYRFTPDNVLKIKLSSIGINALLAETRNILKEIAHRVSV